MRSRHTLALHYVFGVLAERLAVVRTESHLNLTLKVQRGALEGFLRLPRRHIRLRFPCHEMPDLLSVDVPAFRDRDFVGNAAFPFNFLDTCHRFRLTPQPARDILTGGKRTVFPFLVHAVLTLSMSGTALLFCPLLFRRPGTPPFEKAEYLRFRLTLFGRLPVFRLFCLFLLFHDFLIDFLHFGNVL